MKKVTIFNTVSKNVGTIFPLKNKIFSSYYRMSIAKIILQNDTIML